MAKLAFVVTFALLAVAYVDGLKCYECKNCTEVKDDQLKNCTETGCYIFGNPKDESWNRGCAASKNAICTKNETDDFKCSFCEEDKCNSGSYLAASIVLSASMAAVIRMLH